jgi:hypothetical protein
MADTTGEWVTNRVIEGSNAYVDWLRGPGGKYPPKYQEHQRWSIVVQLAFGSSLRQFIDVLKQEEKAAKFRFEVPKFYLRARPHVEKSSQIFTATVDQAFLDVVVKSERVSQLAERIIVSQVLPDDAVCPTAGATVANNAGSVEPDEAEAGGSNAAGRGVVVIGIIDEGIAFGHQRFRRGPYNSRVEYAWIQDGRCLLDVAGYHYGRELCKADRLDANGNVMIEGIDTLLRSCTHNGILDEDLFGSRAGLIDYTRPGHKAAAQRVAHGTHVMDLACGFEEGKSPTSNGLDARPIICVQLPSVTVADTSGLGLERYMLDAVGYILERAEAIRASRKCGHLPVVINFSSGILAGPHDGTHPIEAALDNVIAARHPRAPTDVVLPSGNSHLSRIHFCTKLPARSDGDDNTVTCQWCVPPDGKTCSYVEIWLPRNCLDAVKLRLVPPNGAESPGLPDTGANSLLWSPAGDGLCKVYYEYFPEPTARVRYTIAVLPTAFDEPPTQLAPSGVWKILLTNTTPNEIDGVHAWIHWDDRPLGYPISGRQSYFIDPNYEKVDETSGREVEDDQPASAVKRGGSMNAIATGSRTVVVGGFKPKEMTVVKYSTGGPVPTTTDRTGPDALAESETSSVRRFILAAGTRSGSVVAMNGTSVAAPQVTREIANCRGKGDLRPGRQILRELAEGQEPGHPKPHPSKERGGYGRIVTGASEWKPHSSSSGAGGSSQLAPVVGRERVSFLSFLWQKFR